MPTEILTPHVYQNSFTSYKNQNTYDANFHLSQHFTTSSRVFTRYNVPAPRLTASIRARSSLRPHTIANGQVFSMDMTVEQKILNKTFHPFPRLPPELRREIWSQATRDFTIPGVHFFDAQPFFRDEYSPCEIEFTSPGCTFRCKKGGYPTATLCGYWEHANVSSYLEDSGLWTACHESRDVLQHKVKPIHQHCKLYCNKAGTLVDCVVEHPPITGLFQDEQRTTPRLFTFYPDRDLFVLSCVDLEQLLDLTASEVIIGADEWPLCDFLNVAIEYDPAWGKALRGTEACDFQGDMPGSVGSFILLTVESGWRHIYLIDYQIKCDKAVRKWEAETGKSATAFATSKGRFICVSDGRRLKDEDGVLNDAAASDDGDGDDDACGCATCYQDPCEDDIRNGTLRKGESPYCSYFCDFLKDEIEITGRGRRSAEVDVLAWLPW